MESQVLVYSKTSLQIDRISPRRPRALYFSEDIYVGWTQGGDVEIISTDPNLGPVFYRMNVPSANASLPARVVRSRECLRCHGNSRTSNVPRFLVRSVRSDIRGFPLFATGTHLTDDDSPIKERWGGWYVTGSNGGQRHMGNLIYEETKGSEAHIIRDMGTELTDLTGIIDTSPYLQNTSDIVALMVLEHQSNAHNAITKANFTTRKMLHHNREMATYWGNSPSTLSDTTKRIIASQADQLLRVLLFKDAFEFESWGIEGNEAFQRAFHCNARRSAEGRSLKDFDLLSRLFKHRLSYMIYAESFGTLPNEFLTVFYKKLFAMLEDPSAHEDSKHLSPTEARRIKEILLETKEGLPEVP
ncbi:MAG: hypothetical protein ACI8T1_001370 [Verrucomicrobiales bacterium]